VTFFKTIDVRIKKAKVCRHISTPSYVFYGFSSFPRVIALRLLQEVEVKKGKCKVAVIFCKVMRLGLGEHCKSVEIY